MHSTETNTGQKRKLSHQAWTWLLYQNLETLSDYVLKTQDRLYWDLRHSLQLFQLPQIWENGRWVPQQSQMSVTPDAPDHRGKRRKHSTQLDWKFTFIGQLRMSFKRLLTQRKSLTFTRFMECECHPGCSSVWVLGWRSLLAQGSGEKQFVRHFPCSSWDFQQTNIFCWWEGQKNVTFNAPRLYLTTYALLNTIKTPITATVFLDEVPRKWLACNPETDNRSLWYRWTDSRIRGLSWWNAKRVQGNKLDPAFCSQVTGGTDLSQLAWLTNLKQTKGCITGVTVKNITAKYITKGIMPEFA